MPACGRGVQTTTREATPAEARKYMDRLVPPKVGDRLFPLAAGSLIVLFGRFMLVLAAAMAWSGELVGVILGLLLGGFGLVCGWIAWVVVRGREPIPRVAEHRLSVERVALVRSADDSSERWLLVLDNRQTWTVSTQGLESRSDAALLDGLARGTLIVQALGHVCLARWAEGPPAPVVHPPDPTWKPEGELVYDDVRPGLIPTPRWLSGDTEDPEAEA